MEAKSVVVIHDASEEINSKVFDWAIHGLSLKAGDKLTLFVVLHEFRTPMGYKISLDSRSMVGANEKIIEAQAAEKKQEYRKNEKLAQIFELYKSKKVGFKVEMVRGSSPKAVALRSAQNLKATWVILDRQMKKDEEYLLQSLSCGMSRIRSHDRIVHLRGELDLPTETQITTPETYVDSVATSLEEEELFSTEVLPKKYQMSPDQGQIQISPYEEKGCLATTLKSNQTSKVINPDQLSMDQKDINSNHLIGPIQRDQQCQFKEQIQTRPHGEERDSTLKQTLQERDSYMICGGSYKEEQRMESLSNQPYQNQKSECCIFTGGAKGYFLRGAEEYEVCENFFSLSNLF